MNELAEYGLPFIAAAVVCLAEGLLLLAIFFGGLAVRAILHGFTGQILAGKIEAEHNAFRRE